MIEIRTQDGIALDISPDSEFQIQLDQPFLSDDVLPTPFSTPIAFPFTETNCGVFKFLPAMFAVPVVKEINATIYVGGLEFMAGKLDFDGIENDCLHYTFSANSVDAKWSDPLNDEISGINADAAFDGYDNVDVVAPIMVNDGFQAKSFALYLAHPDTECTTVQKVCNFNGGRDQGGTIAGLGGVDNCCLAPVLRLRHILRKIAPDIVVPNDALPLFNQIGIVCNSKNSVFWHRGDSISLTPDFEPDKPYSAFLEGFCKMVCARVFIINGKVVLKSFADIINSVATVIDEYISEEYDVSVVTGRGYRLGFEGNDNEIVSDTPIDEPYSEMFPFAESRLGEYVPFRVANDWEINDVVSGRMRREVHSQTRTVYKSFDADVVMHDTDTIELFPSKDSVFDSTIGMELVKCIPVLETSDNSLSVSMPVGLYPIVKKKEDGTARTTRVVVGLIKGRQFVDGSVYLKPGPVSGYRDYSDDVSLRTKDLLRYHASFAQWLAEDHVCVKLKLNLSATQLVALSLAERVYFKGRYWIFKHLSVTLMAGSESIISEAEFIEL